MTNDKNDGQVEKVRGMYVSPKCIVEGVELLPLQLPLVLERVRVVAKLVE